MSSDLVFDKFYDKALKFLSFRPRSEKEVKDNLLKKKADQSIIEIIIEKLKEQKFLNDEEFVKWWIEQRTNFKPRSLRLIKMELKQKGISDEAIQNSEFRIQNDLEMAKKLVEKKIKKYKNLSRQEIYQKMGRFLTSKGFGWDTIKRSIDEVLNE